MGWTSTGVRALLYGFLPLVLITGLCWLVGWPAFFCSFGLDSGRPLYEDLLGTLHASDFRLAGRDPYYDKAFHDGTMLINLPPAMLWLCAAACLRAAHLVPLAWGIYLAASVALGWLLGQARRQNLAGLLGLGLIFSAAVQLAIERANTDLLVFALTALSVILYQAYRKEKGRRGAAVWLCAFGALVFFLASIKLYPVALLALPAWDLAQARFGNRLLWGLLAVFSLAFGLYLARVQSLILVAMANSPYQNRNSFGLLALGGDNEFHQPYPAVLIWIATLGGLAMGLVLVRAYKPGTHLAAALAEGRSSASALCWVAGCSLLCFCFIATTSFDYRFVLALLLVPQLVDWLAHPGPPRRLALWLVGLLWVSINFSALASLVRYNIPIALRHDWALYILLAKHSLVLALITLLAASLVGGLYLGIMYERPSRVSVSAPAEAA